MAGKPLPLCKAILICDQVILDAYTRRLTVVGVRDGFGLDSFQDPLPPFCLFARMIEGVGSYNISVEIIDLSDGSVIDARSIPLVFDGRSESALLRSYYGDLRLVRPGVYDAVVSADGAVIDRQKFRAYLTWGVGDGSSSGYAG